MLRLYGVDRNGSMVTVGSRDGGCCGSAVCSCSVHTFQPEKGKKKKKNMSCHVISCFSSSVGVYVMVQHTRQSSPFRVVPTRSSKRPSSLKSLGAFLKRQTTAVVEGGAGALGGPKIGSAEQTTCSGRQHGMPVVEAVAFQHSAAPSASPKEETTARTVLH